MSEPVPTSPERRGFLTSVAAVAGAVSLAGCPSSGEPSGVGNSGATDVVVSSLASDPKTVSVKITETGAETSRTDRTISVVPGEVIDPVNSGKLPTNTGYTVAVMVEGGPSETFEWAEPTVELAPLWVQVDDSRNIRFLLQAG